MLYIALKMQLQCFISIHIIRLLLLMLLSEQCYVHFPRNVGTRMYAQLFYKNNPLNFKGIGRKEIPCRWQIYHGRRVLLSPHRFPDTARSDVQGVSGASRVLREDNPASLRPGHVATTLEGWANGATACRSLMCSLPVKMINVCHRHALVLL